jgi:hypothetical protein
MMKEVVVFNTFSPHFHTKPAAHNRAQKSSDHKHTASCQAKQLAINKRAAHHRTAHASQNTRSYVSLSLLTVTFA